MTDFSDDELVSAVLDGEASDTEVARVDADPVLAARLIELRSARDSIAASGRPAVERTARRGDRRGDRSGACSRGDSHRSG